MPRTSLKPYPISPTCRAHSAALGFDPDHPEQMTQTPNHEAASVLPYQPPAKRGIGRRVKALAALLCGSACLLIADAASGAPTYDAVPNTQPDSLTIDSLPELKLEGVIRRVEPQPQPIPLSFLATILILTGGGLIWRELRQLNRAQTAFAKRALSTNKDADMPRADEAGSNAPNASDSDESNQWCITLGGASHKGQVRKENQDAFSIGNIDDGHGFMIVCDGVGGHPGGRAAARFAASTLKRRLEMASVVGLDADAALEDSLAHAAAQMASHEIEGLTTALLVQLDGNHLTWAALGDGRICVVHPDGMAQDVLAPHHAVDQPDNVITAWLEAGRQFAPRLGSMRLETGSLVMAMSDGAGDLLDLEGIAQNRALYIKAIDKRGALTVSDRILEQLEALTHENSSVPLHTDNLTLTMATVVQKESNP